VECEILLNPCIINSVPNWESPWAYLIGTPGLLARIFHHGTLFIQQ